MALPSHCEHCPPLDLVPVFSYLLLKGRCRYCKVTIPWRSPLVEVVTGLLFAYVAFRYEVTLETVVVLGFVGVLIVVFFIDLEHSLILNRVMYPAVAAALLVAPLGSLGQDQDALHAYMDALLGIAIGGGVLYVIFLAARGGFGGGDVKLAGLLGPSWVYLRYLSPFHFRSSPAAFSPSACLFSRCAAGRMLSRLAPSLQGPDW